MKKFLLYFGIVFSSLMLFSGIKVTFTQNSGGASKTADIILIVLFALIDIFCIRKLVKNKKKTKELDKKIEKTLQQQTQITPKTYNNQQNYAPPATKQDSQDLHKAIDFKRIQISVAQTSAKADSSYSGFTPDLNKSIVEISEDARKHSDAMYQLHQQEFMKFDPFNLDITIVDDKPLTSVEKSFLKYIAGSSVVNPNIPGYWTYEYNINYKKLLTTFLVKGYLRISSDYDSIPYLKVEDLKNILRESGLQIGGKKDELVKRIQDNVSIDIIKSYTQESNKKYILTEQGKYITNAVKDSATKDTDLEDLCLQLISDSRFNDAYAEICKNELNKNISRGFVNWQNELNSGLSPVQIDCFKNFMSDSELIFPPDITPAQHINTKSCIILGIMLGVDIRKIYKMFCRVTDTTYNKTTVIPFLQNLQFNIMDNIQKNNIKQYV